MRNKLFIFDCDGVLVDSEVIAHSVELEALNKLVYQMTLGESIRRFTGVNHKTEHQILYNDFGINLPTEFYMDRQRATLKAFESELKPILNILKNENLSQCVASSSTKERVIHALKLTE